MERMRTGEGQKDRGVEQEWKQGRRRGRENVGGRTSSDSSLVKRKNSSAILVRGLEEALGGVRGGVRGGVGGGE